MHSFFSAQVGSGSSKSPNSEPLETPALGTEAEDPPPFHHREEMAGDYVLLSVTPDSKDETASEHDDEDGGVLPLQSHERKELPRAPERSPKSTLHSYPTPPTSQTPSVHNLTLSEGSSEGDGASVRKGAPPAHPSNVHAAHFSNPSDRYPATTPSTPIHSRINSEFHESPSIERLKKLTDDASRKKSIPPTPTRALSHTTVKSDASNGSDPPAGQNGKPKTSEPISSQLSAGTSGAAVTVPKGKLTVKINEARGLRKSRDPYVVAVFQRNELVSKGPRDDEEDDKEDSSASIPMGGIPIMRSGSDSGRPMAIPMKSRQSSNTSLSDYRDFKIKGRKSFTNPKWDTEAVFDVVGADARVNITIYDRGTANEEFLGHANFKGFTFVDESSMDEHMQGIGRSVKDEYDDMDEDEKRDQDWEDPFDLPDKRGGRGDRMSGIVKTGTNEDFNGGHFDL
ncbi:Serine threonine-kinase SCH9 [Hyphodiscus hymeniophilus]|uniref:Serine threonine-kinase SCH9 n=1 Tax=Hyphodiscus hymeniophilus TaxID=353542 RepID=A0A9P6VKC5_9HELO|nr:Serine threonine-kinase SCH9 [Hyphodiscus hymeniophilus]